MGNTLKIWKIGKYWEILYKKRSTKKEDLSCCFFCKKNGFKLYRFYYVTVPFKICYKVNCIGKLYKMKMKAASL